MCQPERVAELRRQTQLTKLQSKKHLHHENIEVQRARNTEQVLLAPVRLNIYLISDKS